MNVQINMKNIMKKGFTLIELLIVMAILGVLAVVVLVAINPAEQLARTRDAGRVSSVTQIGHGIQAYYTAHNAVYPGASTWGSALSTSGELNSVPGAIAFADASTPCSTGATSGWCYATGATDTIVYTRLESKSYGSKCSANTAWMLFSTTQGRGGTHCHAGEPVAATDYAFQ
jgi:prepilin-type N-terminal cleavage/methylation domain-containing protein